MKKRSSATSEQILELLYEKREALRNELNSVEVAIKVVNSISESKVIPPVFEDVNGITTITEYMYNGNYQTLSDILSEEEQRVPVRVRESRPMKLKNN